jgi:hypothetical protein
LIPSIHTSLSCSGFKYECAPCFALHLCPLTQILFASQSELSFEHCRLPSSSSSADKRQLHSSKHQRHQNRSEVVTFPLIHFDCALAPAAAGAFSVVSFQETDVVTPLSQARRSNHLCRLLFSCAFLHRFFFFVRTLRLVRVSRRISY